MIFSLGGWWFQTRYFESQQQQHQQQQLKDRSWGGSRQQYDPFKPPGKSLPSGND
jgi:hypothetical protein